MSSDELLVEISKRLDRMDARLAELVELCHAQSEQLDDLEAIVDEMIEDAPQPPIPVANVNGG